MRNIHVTSLLFLVGAACGDDQHSNQTPDAAAPMPDAAPMLNGCQKLGLTPSTMDSALAWHGTNRADISTWLDKAGCASASFDPSHRPIATFDWDNTISKNDFGDAITFFMIKNGKVVQPPNHDWHATSAYMTD